MTASLFGKKLAIIGIVALTAGALFWLAAKIPAIIFRV